MSEIRKNRVKVFFTEEDLGRLKVSVALTHMNINISLMARLVLRKKYEKRDTSLVDFKVNGIKKHEMLILFNDFEKELLTQLGEIHKISNSEVVRALALTFLEGNK